MKKIDKKEVIIFIVLLIITSAIYFPLSVFIILMITCTIYAPLLMGHYATDTYNIINKGYETYAITYSLNDGRPIMCLISLIAQKLNMPIMVYVIILTAIALIVSNISVIKLKNITVKYIEEKNKKTEYHGNQEESGSGVQRRSGHLVLCKIPLRGEGLRRLHGNRQHGRVLETRTRKDREARHGAGRHGTRDARHRAGVLREKHPLHGLRQHPAQRDLPHFGKFGAHFPGHRHHRIRQADRS